MESLRGTDDSWPDYSTDDDMHAFEFDVNKSQRKAGLPMGDWR